VSSAVETAARHQVVFREVNERIAERTGLLNETGFNLLICECSDLACAEALEITREEYEAVRADPARFVVLDGHQMPEVERVVGGNGRYVVVEKIGAAAEIAHAGDARRREQAGTDDSYAEKRKR
jgi:hypothetical protein